MLEYYKVQYPIEDKQVGNWIYKDCPKRTEKYYKKLTVDEKMFIEVAFRVCRVFDKWFDYFGLTVLFCVC